VALYRDRGVVLRTVKLGDSDRIVTVLTQGHGKVRAVAKGARKSGSRFSARLEPVAHLALQLYEGRGDLDTVTQVETVDLHRAVREHYGALTAALAMCEATDLVLQEREPAPAVYDMLVRALHTLAERPGPVLAAAFLWKLLSLEGFQPSLDRCAACGGEPDPSQRAEAFDAVLGGVLCPACAGPLAVRPAAGTVPLLRAVLGGELRRAMEVADGPPVRALEALAVSAFEHHLDRRLRTGAALAGLHGSSW
jgi:DNA repair protein RecO (recombination protein O)